MNNNGELFLKKVYKKLKEKRKEYIINIDYDNERIEERMMRCGIEAKLYEPENTDELRQIAIATLIEDKLKNS